MNNIGNFVELKKSGKIWAIGSIHSNLKSFNSIKNYILKNFNSNDKLIFLIYKPTIDDLVSLFKNAKTAILCHPGIIHIASALNIKIIA